MLGTFVNTGAVIVGSLIGYFFKNLIPERYSDTIMKAISLGVILIGLQMALEVQNILLMIFSLFLGSLIGEIINIEEGLDKAGDFVEKKLSKLKGDISQGFVAATLLYCTGSMAIVGAIEGGLLGKHDILIAKSFLDGVVSIALAASLGIGVLFSSLSVLLYQGTIVLIAGLAKNLLTDVVVNEMSAVGGLLIMAIGLNFLLKDRIRIGNLLPAMFIPILYFMVVK
ncbi:MAG: DUF554 domain-containing protein [Tissierellales bacterium]|jgi:hypothetical protein|nr:DUF554 domain-containing protein [Tissierellales bacterium]HCX03707.1 DUF554 domain-containing protein [Clostridiales bacterium]